MDNEAKQLKALFTEIDAQVRRVREAQRRKREQAEQAQRSKRTTWRDLKAFVDPIVWDWPGWLPRGFLTILAAEPGMGKSLLCLRIGACYLSGRDWPDGRPFTGQRGQVVWCEGEASQALNLARAEAQHLRLDDIVSPLPHPLTAFRMDDQNHMVALLEMCRLPETQLVVMDSLSSLVVGGSIPKAMYDLGEIARVSGKPILLTHHLRKRTGVDEAGRINLERIRGTSRIAQAARVAWTLDAPDLADRENRRLMVAKNNLMAAGEALGMRVGEEGLRFGEVPRGRLMGAETERVSQFERAVELMVEMLGAGPRAATEMEAAFELEGLSKSTALRAKKRLGVMSYRAVGEGTGWLWRMGERG